MEAKPILIPWQTLQAYETDLLEAAGLPRPDAERVAENLVNSDLRGVYSHGIQNLGNYLRGLKAGRIDAWAKMEVVRESPAAVYIDAHNGMGQLASIKAMELIIPKAKAVGVAYGAVGHSNHYGAAAYYALMAADQGLIGYSTTTSGRSQIAPTGGLTRSVGNDPLCWAMPSGDKYPVVLDMATSVVAHGKLNIQANKGEDIPFGWATDAEGNPTHDARVMEKGGLLLPIAGPKGYGLSFVGEVLCGVLTHSLYGTDRTNAHMKPDDPGDSGHFFMAIDPTVVMPLEEFKKNVARLSEMMRTGKQMVGVDRIYVPGEPEWDKYDQNLAHGVPVLPKVWENTAGIAADLGVKVPAIG